MLSKLKFSIHAQGGGQSGADNRSTLVASLAELINTLLMVIVARKLAELVASTSTDLGPAFVM
jgi:hypothetical protein